MAKISAFGYLSFASDTAKPENQKLHSFIEELSSEISQKLVFFDLELGKYGEKFLNSDVLKDYRYYIKKSVESHKYNLSEELEALSMEKNLTGKQALTAMFDEHFGQFEFTMNTVEGEKHFNEETALASMHSANREYRHQVYERFLDEVGKSKNFLGSIYNNIILDHRLNIKRRGFSDVMDLRNLRNEVSGKSVLSMLNVVESGYGLARKYFKMKAELLGIKEMTNADIYAPIDSKSESISFFDAKSITIEAYSNFDKDAGRIVSDFFQNRTDAPIRPGKRPGAFCYGPSPEMDAFVHLNYTGDIRSVQTLAHELGHGLHHQLSKRNNHLNFDTPLVTAETASVFGEILLNELLFERAKTREEKLSILCSQMEGIIATVFRQTVLTRFEQESHAKRGEGRIQPEEFCDIWWSVNKKLYGDEIRMVDSYRWGWAYIPHFVHTPFYCYAYSFGQLLVLSLYGQYLKDGSKFKNGYVELLSSGGSDSPAALVKNTVGLDIEDESFWKVSLSILDENLKRIEKLL